MFYCFRRICFRTPLYPLIKAHNLDFPTSVTLGID